MPVINFSYSDLCGLVGREVPREVLLDRLPMMGADPKSVEDGSDELSFEFFPDRPDLYSVEGIARALRAFLDYEPGLRSYAVGDPEAELMVDLSVNEVRPHIWTAIVEGNDIDDPLIRSIMDLQEKLHLTLGRNRKKVAIGIHDFRAVKPPFTYKAVLPHEISFVPLQGDTRMDLAEILEHHEKGRAYARVLEGKDRYPVIVDRDGEVLSFPPIINGVATAVTEETKDIFVDCTGTDVNAVRGAVNIVTTALAERGGKVKAVTVKGPEGTAVAPDLRPRAMAVDVGYINSWIGTRLSAPEMAKCLMRLGHGASVSGEGIQALVAPYRTDVIHLVDLAEDVAIGHGFERFGESLPVRSTFGQEDRVTAFCTRVRPVVIGLGYLEVATLSLSNPAEQFSAMNMADDGSAARVRNPVTEEHAILRTSLLPKLLGILRRNKHRELPQRVFELGEVVVDARNRTMLGGASIHSRAGFTEVKSDLQSIMAALGLECDVAAHDHGGFVPGRCARVTSGGAVLGVFGEVAPSTLSHFGLGFPVAAFELDVESVMDTVETLL